MRYDDSQSNYYYFIGRPEVELGFDLDKVFVAAYNTSTKFIRVNPNATAKSVDYIKEWKQFIVVDPPEDLVLLKIIQGSFVSLNHYRYPLDVGLNRLASTFSILLSAICNEVDLVVYNRLR